MCKGVCVIVRGALKALPVLPKNATVILFVKYALVVI